MSTNTNLPEYDVTISSVTVSWAELQAQQAKKDNALEAAQRRIAALEDGLRELELSIRAASIQTDFCPCCQRYLDSWGAGHISGCPVQRARALLDGAG